MLPADLFRHCPRCGAARPADVDPAELAFPSIRESIRLVVRTKHFLQEGTERTEKEECRETPD